MSCALADREPPCCGNADRRCDANKPAPTPMACCRKFRRLLMTPLFAFAEGMASRAQRDCAAEKKAHHCRKRLEVSREPSARCGERWFASKERRSFVVEVSQQSTIGVRVRVAAPPQ